MVESHIDPKLMRSRIKRLIVECLFIEGLDPEDIEDDASLRDEFGLDSVDVLEVVLGMEQEFQTRIVLKGVDKEAFASVNSLARVLVSCLAQPRS